MERQGHKSDPQDAVQIDQTPTAKSPISDLLSPRLLTPEDALQAIQCVPDAVLFLTPSLTLVRWNRSAESMLRLTASDIDQVGWLNRFASADKLRVQVLLAACQHSDAMAIELSLVVPPAAPIDLRLHACRLSDEIRPASYMLVATDITDLKRAQREADEAIRGRDQFLAMLSHELRNPCQRSSMLMKSSSHQQVEKWPQRKRVMWPRGN